MLFSEIYGSYYTAVAQILSRAVDGSLTGKELTGIVQDTAFGAIHIPTWPNTGRERESRRQSSGVGLSCLC